MEAYMHENNFSIVWHFIYILAALHTIICIVVCHMLYHSAADSMHLNCMIITYVYILHYNSVIFNLILNLMITILSMPVSLKYSFYNSLLFYFHTDMQYLMLAQ